MLRGWINHLDLTVTDLEVSEPFYDRVLGYLGFERAEVPGVVWHARRDELRLFGIGLHQARPGTEPHDRYAPGLHHVAFQAASRDDVDGLHRLLVEMNATILDPPADYPQYWPVYYALFFADPDGLKLELVHMA